MLSGQRNFNAAQKAIQSHNFIIGLSEKSKLFTAKISELLQLDDINLPNANRAVGDVELGTAISKTLYKELEFLLKDDMKLYDFIDSHSVYTSLTNSIPFAELESNESLKNTVSSLTRSRVSISTDYKNVTVADVKEIFVPIQIKNQNDFDLFTNDKCRIFSSYHIFNMDGKLVHWDGVRSNLPVTLVAGKTVNNLVKVAMPTSLKVFKLRIGLLHETVSWFESDNPLHEIEIVITKD